MEIVLVAAGVVVGLLCGWLLARRCGGRATEPATTEPARVGDEPAGGRRTGGSDGLTPTWTDVVDRLAFGVVKGYEEDATQIPPWTTMGGAFDLETAHEAKEPWKLPETWHKAKDQIEKSTPLNFVSTADIIGGNSGSPVINRAGELVAVIFDSNLQGLTASYFYEDKVARAVSVHSSAIPEALRKIYRAHDLAEQLGR